MRGARGALAFPIFLLALVLILLGIGIVIAAWVLAKLLGVLLIVAGFWLIRATEDLGGAPRSD